jgi:hypothetical protein
MSVQSGSGTGVDGAGVGYGTLHTLPGSGVPHGSNGSFVGTGVGGGVLVGVGLGRPRMNVAGGWVGMRMVIGGKA